jgi:hypothetical protein
MPTVPITKIIRSSGIANQHLVPRDEWNLHKEQIHKDNNLLMTIMASLVAFVAITFIVEIAAMHRNYASDKSLALQNNQLNKDYFDKVLLLQTQISDLKTQLEITKVKNYLK